MSAEEFIIRYYYYKKSSSKLTVPDSLVEQLGWNHKKQLVCENKVVDCVSGNFIRPFNIHKDHPEIDEITYLYYYESQGYSITLSHKIAKWIKLRNKEELKAVITEIEGNRGIFITKMK